MDALVANEGQDRYPRLPEGDYDLINAYSVACCEIVAAWWKLRESYRPSGVETAKTYNARTALLARLAVDGSFAKGVRSTRPEEYEYSRYNDVLSSD